MSFNIFELAGIFILLYMLLPTICGRVLHLGTHYQGHRNIPRVALTFDDGPDPLHTPKVLEILKKHNAHATFFVVGQHAKKHPELVKQVLAEGHSLGTHGFAHRFAWLQGPIGAIQEIRQGEKIIEQITGKPPALFRPSWGVFNIVTYFYLLLKHPQTILWSFMTWDWHSSTTPAEIQALVRTKVKPGSVIVFHDHATKPGATENGPTKMLQALPAILQDLQEKGFEPVTVEDLLAPRRPGILKYCLRQIWQVWELAFDKLAGLKPIGDEKENLFRLAVRDYRGQTMQLPDGTLLAPGDKVGEIHLNNHFLQHLTSRARSLELTGIMLLRETRRSLPLLARAIVQDPSYQGIKALIGITMIHRGTVQLGFTVHELSPGLRSVVAWYQRWLLYLMHPGGLAHLRRQWHKLVPKKVVISRQELLQRYLREGIGWPERGNTSPPKGSISAR